MFDITSQTNFEGEIKDAKMRSFSSYPNKSRCMISFVFGFSIINEFENYNSRNRVGRKVLLLLE